MSYRNIVRSFMQHSTTGTSNIGQTNGLVIQWTSPKVVNVTLHIMITKECWKLAFDEAGELLKGPRRQGHQEQEHRELVSRLHTPSPATRIPSRRWRCTNVKASHLPLPLEIAIARQRHVGIPSHIPRLACFLMQMRLPLLLLLLLLLLYNPLLLTEPEAKSQTRTNTTTNSGRGTN